MKRSKADRALFNAQVQRLSASNFFPQIKAGITELIDSLMRVSDEDADRARRIIDRALKSPQCPTPAELESIASNLGAENVPKGCGKCEGTGMRYVTKPVRDPITGQIYEADCQERCDCELGRFLMAREVERKQMERTA
jgi:hypothetical protein